MGADNTKIQKSQPSQKGNQQEASIKSQKGQKPASNIIQDNKQTQFSLPEGIKNRQQVRKCIEKYNQKVQLQMQKEYVKNFFAMREKLLNKMQSHCKNEYQLKDIKIKSPQFKQCMTAVQSLITQEDQRMQSQFGIKLFLLADKCLINRKDQKDNPAKLQFCIGKLMKYRSLNMQMHILKLELAKQML